MDVVSQDVPSGEKSEPQSRLLNNHVGMASSLPNATPGSPQTTSPSAKFLPPWPTSEETCTKMKNPVLAPEGPNDGPQRVGSPPSRPSGLTTDIAAKMKAFSLSRQGAPGQSIRPPAGAGHALSTNNAAPTRGLATGAVSQSEIQQSTGPSSPVGPLPAAVGALKLPPGLARPKVSNWNSSPQMGGAESTTAGPRPAMGGLAAKRGIKGGGMKLSDANGPPQPSSAGATNGSLPLTNSTGSAFSKYSKMIDTKTGTLNFQNKAVIHSGGIEFTSGTSFSISLDEVDTMGELGKGNYGTVYKVRHSRPKMRRPGQGLRGNMSTWSSAESLSRSDSNESTASAPAASGTGIVMAMKEIRLELDDAKFAAIIMELDILHRCISPFIVSFYGAFFQEGSVYICLEFMDGGSVDKLYGDGIPEGVLKKIALSTVMGLRFLKDEHNIIHRDVKPTNILVNTRGQVKICDFGVSGNLVASIAKTNIGCQSYMAPERISGGGVAQAGANPGGGTYSVQSDVWSLGLTIVECALGRYPYAPETYNNIFSQLSAIVDGDPPDLPSSGYSEAARAFVSSCLHKVPKMRPTYAMLMRHAWLSPLLKAPTIAEEEDEDEQVPKSVAATGVDTQVDASSSPAESPTAEISHPETADREVAEWVRSALQRKASGKTSGNGKPALHAAPLDQVVSSPLLERGALNSTSEGAVKPEDPGAGLLSKAPDGGHGRTQGDLVNKSSDAATARLATPEPAQATILDSPELRKEKVESKDFAGDPRISEN